MLAEEQQPQLAPPCEVGSRVGVIAPSGPVKSKLLSEGLQVLRDWGLVPVLYRGAAAAAAAGDESFSSVGEDVPFLETAGGGSSGPVAAASLATAEASGFMSASDAERATELQAALADASTSAVICAKGGYGAVRLLPLVDWGAAGAGARRKRFVGFSDATALHAALHGATTSGAAAAADEAATAGAEELDGKATEAVVEQGGCVTFHGPMLATGRTFTALPAADISRFRAALFAPTLDEGLFSPLAGQPLYGAVGAGNVRGVGVLVGGNLTTLASICGSAWGAGPGAGNLPYILALEDENETTQRIDRHCQQLRLAGVLKDGGGGGDGEGDDRGRATGGVGGGGGGAGDEGVRAARGRRGVLAGVVLGRFDKDDVQLPSGALGAARAGKDRGTASLCCAKQTWGDDAMDRRTRDRFGRYIDNADGAEAQAFFWRRVVQLGAAVPTVWRCGFGHGTENATLPLGAICAVDPARGVLELATPDECAAMRAAAGRQPPE